jgi:thiol-disulfide isomerase/thioredoxin
MKTIESVDQLITELSQSRDQLVVVDFFARWCGSCRALYPKLVKLAESNPECIVLKVDFDSNKKLCKALDVKVLPFFQLYRGAEGRVAAFSASVAKVQRLRDALELYSSPRCSVGNSPIVSELSSLLTTEDGRVVPGGAAQEQAAQQQAMPI